jgi:alcohol dehydrogenase class IV
MDVDLLLNLRKFLAPEIIYGPGSIALAGLHARNLGATKTLIVTDPGVAAHGWLEPVEASLAQEGMPYSVFTEVTANPKDHEVMTGAEVYRSSGCDLVLAVGGGSPMDCAKGISVVVSNPGSIVAYAGVDEVKNPGPPLVFIPTTAGSSADVSQFAIINDTDQRVKIAIISKMVIPDLALIDPATTLTMSPELTAATGMDALCHAFEAYVSNASSPLTDMAALNAVELVVANLAAACSDPDNLLYRDKMMMASLMAGLAFSNASLGLVHGMAHSLGGLCGLAHGECNAILLEKVVEYNYEAAGEKYDRLAAAFGLDFGSVDPAGRAALLAGEIAKLRLELGIETRLVDMGVAPDQLARLTQFAYQDPCLATNPKAVSREAIDAIYQSIYR